MSPLRWAVGTVASLALVGVGSTAQQVPTAELAQRPDITPRDAELETVIVEAKRRREILEQRINSFVTSIAIQSHTESLARWQVAICPLVAGASPGNAAYIQGRVSQVATDSGVPLAGSKCAPNLVIVLTPEPEELLRDWWARSHRLFNKDRGVVPIDRFIQSEETIRVWYNACSVAPGLSKTFVIKGDPNCGTGELGSRLSWQAVRSIYSVIVVVDLERIKGTNLGQLADYVAVVGLAQIRRDAELRTLPTILNLFAETAAARPQGMSSWDRSFLKSLYKTESGNVTQVSQIKTGMKRDLVP